MGTKEQVPSRSVSVYRVLTEAGRDGNKGKGKSRRRSPSSGPHTVHGPSWPLQSRTKDQKPCSGGSRALGCLVQVTPACGCWAFVSNRVFRRQGPGGRAGSTPSLETTQSAWHVAWRGCSRRRSETSHSPASCVRVPAQNSSAVHERRRLTVSKKKIKPTMKA